MRASGALQKRASAYGELRSAAYSVRLLLAENVPTDFYKVNNPFPPPSSERGSTVINNAIANALARIGPKTFVDNLGFVPSPEDEDILRRIRAKSSQLSAVIGQLIESNRVGAPIKNRRSLRYSAEQLASDMNHLSIQLANATTARTDALIAQNASAYASSRNLFIGVASGAIVLALLLGVLVSWSLIGPIQRIDSRLAAIGSGRLLRARRGQQP